MAKVVMPLICTVEVIGKPKQSSHGNGYYHSVLFLDESKTGEAAKIWKSLSGEEVSRVMKGDLVQLVPAGNDSKGNVKHNIVLLSSTATTVPTTAPAPLQSQPVPGLTPEQKRAIAAWGSDVIKAYSFLYQQAKAELEQHGASEETIRAAASSALIACQQHGLLDR